MDVHLRRVKADMDTASESRRSPGAGFDLGHWILSLCFLVTAGMVIWAFLNCLTSVGLSGLWVMAGF